MVTYLLCCNFKYILIGNMHINPCVKGFVNNIYVQNNFTVETDLWIGPLKTVI